ncbi:WG repeat-containing protein [Chryseobacterium sp. Leaf405]|uniref:WG repeat-containing protein n=1 Tax=Chryseobacterium sp. Leaf405 TaxID=1736367 RepID=UPI001619860A|nr:WG repeat-containing protein [Chryseobacterium sp. Leaf405]
MDLSKKNISHWELDKETNWFRVKLNNPDKWGFVNKDSIIQIPFEYDFLNPFENGLAYAKNDGKEFFITKNNLKLEGDYDGINVFSYGLAAVHKNGKWGFIDNSGKLIIPLVYDNVDYFRYSGLAAVKKDGKSGFINKLGAEIIPIIYDGAYQEMKDSNVLVEKNKKWAVFNNKGKQLSEFKYDNLNSFKRAYITDFSKDIFKRDESTFFENGAALVETNGKFEFINSRAQAAFPNNKFDSATVFDTYHNAIVKRNGKYGIIKPTGEFRIPLEYDFIEYYDTHHLNSEYYNVKKGKIFFFYNKDLKKIGESEEPIYNDFSVSNPTITYKNLKGKYGIVDWQGNVVIPFDYDGIYKIEGTHFLSVKKGKYYGVISESGKTKIPTKYESLFPVYDKFDDEDLRQKNLFVADEKLIDINNKILIREYDSIMPIFYNHNKLIVSKNKKYGIIDVDNKILLPIVYDEISNWVEYGPEKRHFIKKNGKTGLIESETFKIIIPPIYDRFEQRMNLVLQIKITNMVF